MNALSARARVLITVVAAIALAAVVVGYALVSGREPATAPTGPAVPGPRLLVLTNGVLSSVSRADPGGPRELTGVRCDRFAAAGGTRACLTPAGPLSATRLELLDDRLRTVRQVPLTGLPNRLRVSPSGRLVAWTLFIDGHSYATAGFSTQTGVLDTRTGKVIDSLETFRGPFTAVDVNYWGVTFAADDNRFYATLSTGGRRYLVEGDLAARTVKALRENVECPSLSPDGTRIAYKSAVGGDPARGWRLSVLDLAGGRVTPLAETASVDDQPVWLDDRTVAYALQRSDGTEDVWRTPADGTGRPALLVTGAGSPSP